MGDDEILFDVQKPVRRDSSHLRELQHKTRFSSHTPILYAAHAPHLASPHTSGDSCSLTYSRNLPMVVPFRTSMAWKDRMTDTVA